MRSSQQAEWVGRIPLAAGCMDGLVCAMCPSGEGRVRKVWLAVWAV